MKLYPYQIPALLLPVIDTLPETSQRFVREMAERVERYGDQVFFTKPQTNYLYSLKDQFLNVATQPNDDAEDVEALSPLARLKRRKRQLFNDCQKLRKRQYQANVLSATLAPALQACETTRTVGHKTKDGRRNATNLEDALVEIARQASLADAKQKQVG